jgi:hypothetical protein
LLGKGNDFLQRWDSFMLIEMNHQHHHYYILCSFPLLNESAAGMAGVTSGDNIE